MICVSPLKVETYCSPIVDSRSQYGQARTFYLVPTRFFRSREGLVLADISHGWSCIHCQLWISLCDTPSSLTETTAVDRYVALSNQYQKSLGRRLSNFGGRWSTNCIYHWLSPIVSASAVVGTKMPRHHAHLCCPSAGYCPWRFSDACLILSAPDSLSNNIFNFNITRRISIPLFYWESHLHQDQRAIIVIIESIYRRRQFGTSRSSIFLTRSWKAEPGNI